MDWTVVGRKKGRRLGAQLEVHGHGNGVATLCKEQGRGHRTPEEVVQDLKGQLQRMKREIAESAFYRHVLKVMSDAEQLWQSCEESAKEEKVAALQKTTHVASGCAASVEALADEVNSCKLGQLDSGALEGEASASTEQTHDRVSLAEEVDGVATWKWAHVEALVVYGLGSMETSYVSRYQLAFTLLLAEQLPSLKGPVEVFDPVFSNVDCLLLKQLGLKVLEENDHGWRQVFKPTLFYLAHCPRGLCDRLVAANLQQPRSSSCTAIMGNSFDLYYDRWITLKPDLILSPLLRSVKEERVLEIYVGDRDFIVHQAFNNLSLHLFPPTRNTSSLVMRLVNAD